MQEIQNWLKKAETSTAAQRIVNFLFWRLVPFNRPHGILIESVDQHGASVRLPYRKRNCNHLKGLHACGLATAAEFAAGLSLLQRVDPAAYRLIMRRIEVDYVAQGRKTAIARAERTADIETALAETLPAEGEVDVTMKVVVADVSGKELCTATVHWQLKDWNKVRNPTK